jgi:hypothetical protein
MTEPAGRLSIGYVVRSAAALRLSGPAVVVIAIAATALALVDAFTPTAFYVTSIVAIAAIETVLFVSWLSRGSPGFVALLRYSATRVLWIGILAFLRGALATSAFVAAAIVGILLAQGQGLPGVILYFGMLAFAGVAASIVIGRLLCAAPIVVTHELSLGPAMRRSWDATAGSVPVAAMLTFAVYVVDVVLQGGLSLFGIPGLIAALVVGSVVAAAVQAAAYRQLFAP